MPETTPNTGFLTAEQREEFIARIQASESCWTWTGAKNSNGYGMFTHGERQHGAHRIAYQLWVGPIPQGLEIDHVCRVRACVRPDHLEAVTHRENTLRSGNPTAANARKTHCPQGHEYTEENTRIYRGMRYCRECMRTYAARRAEAEGRTLGTPNAGKTHCPQGHPYDEENTLRYKNGNRRCRTCHRERERARAAAKRVTDSEKRERIGA